MKYKIRKEMLDDYVEARLKIVEDGEKYVIGTISTLLKKTDDIKDVFLNDNPVGGYSLILQIMAYVNEVVSLIYHMKKDNQHLYDALKLFDIEVINNEKYV